MNTQSDIHESPVSLGEWLLTLLIISIPIVGLVMLFVWAFSSGTSRTKQNFCRAMLVIGLVIFVTTGIITLGIVAHSVSDRVDTGKWDAGKIGVTKLDQDVQAYVLDDGSPPKSLDDLITKPLNAPSWNGPYAKPADLRDPFGHPYGYVDPGQHGQYDIIFYGRDGKPGGEGIDRDYGNWQ